MNDSYIWYTVITVTVIEIGTHLWSYVAKRISARTKLKVLESKSVTPNSQQTTMEPIHEKTSRPVEVLLHLFAVSVLIWFITGFYMSRAERAFFESMGVGMNFALVERVSWWTELFYSLAVFFGALLFVYLTSRLFLQLMSVSFKWFVSLARPFQKWTVAKPVYAYALVVVMPIAAAQFDPVERQVEYINQNSPVYSDGPLQAQGFSAYSNPDLEIYANLETVLLDSIEAGLVTIDSQATRYYTVRNERFIRGGGYFQRDATVATYHKGKKEYSEPVKARGKTERLLNKEYREKIYGVLRMFEKLSDEHPYDLETSSDSAYQYYLNGLVHLNAYNHDSVLDALDHFKTSLKFDDSFPAAMMYVAYTYNILVDRRWDMEAEPMFIDSSKKYVNRIKKYIPADTTHPLFYKIAGDYAYLMARQHLREFKNVPDMSQDFEYDRYMLEMVSDQLDKAHSYLRRAIVRVPNFYKIRYNLSQVFFKKFQVGILRNDSVSAKLNLELAERAIIEAVREYGLDDGPRVDIAKIWLNRVKHFEQENDHLIEEARQLLAEAVKESTRIRPMWKGYAHYHLAALACYDGDSTLALEELDKAMLNNPSNVIQDALDDPDFEFIHEKLRVTKPS